MRRRLLVALMAAVFSVGVGTAAAATTTPAPSATTTPAPTPSPSQSSGGPLSRLPSNPGLDIIKDATDCKSPPAPRTPTSGIGSWIDPTRPKGAPGAFVSPEQTNVWANYGYGGLHWHTYDLGCAGPVADGAASATIDTWVGNAALGTAANVAAATNAVHAWVSNPATVTDSLDTTVEDAGQLLFDAVWRPWIGVVLALLAAWLIVLSIRGDLPKVVQGVGYVGVILAVSVGIVSAPTAAADSWDGLVVDTIGTVNSSVAGINPPPEGVEPAHAQGALMVDRMLYRFWAKGMFGDPDSEAAKRWGPELWWASTMTYVEAGAVEQRKPIVQAKNAKWTETMDALSEADPVVYAEAQGKGASRAGVGLTALLATLAVSLFRLAAELMLLVSLLLIRFIIMAAPIIGLLGLLPGVSGVVRVTAEIVAACLVNIVGLSIVTVLHGVVVTATLTTAQTTAASFAVAAVTTVAAFILAWPMLNLRRIYGGGPPLRRHLTRVLGAAWLARKLGREVDKRNDDRTLDPDPDRDRGGGPKVTGRPNAKARNTDPVPEAQTVYTARRERVRTETPEVGTSSKRAALPRQRGKAFTDAEDRPHTRNGDNTSEGQDKLYTPPARTIRGEVLSSRTDEVPDTEKPDTYRHRRFGDQPTPAGHVMVWNPATKRDEVAAVPEVDKASSRGVDEGKDQSLVHVTAASPEQSTDGGSTAASERATGRGSAAGSERASRSTPEAGDDWYVPQDSRGEPR